VSNIRSWSLSRRRQSDERDYRTDRAHFGAGAFGSTPMDRPGDDRCRPGADPRVVALSSPFWFGCGSHIFCAGFAVRCAPIVAPYSVRCGLPGFVRGLDGPPPARLQARLAHSPFITPVNVPREACQVRVYGSIVDSTGVQHELDIPASSSTWNRPDAHTATSAEILRGTRVNGEYAPLRRNTRCDVRGSIYGDLLD
jgi:hypothetical protein